MPSTHITKVLTIGRYFAQLTQRAGNFLVAREEMRDFKWTDLKGKDVLGGRKGVVHYTM